MCYGYLSAYVSSIV
ncbi:hypothetical protein F383_12424 [Gossypium arboreum]|uniref:Uncharacterized protein n=1 Tax=Gossypium arboreum TaxID=29729 RepID=A0A0B0N9G2_GOSAR|nr:hypothetical protein F383_12424 [Gossypium arboreum]